MIKKFFVGIFFFVLVSVGFVQYLNIEYGFVLEGVYDFKDVDNINLFNGNLMFMLLIGQIYKVGDGFSYGLMLVYNLKVWDFDVFGINQGMIFVFLDQFLNVGLGWQFYLGWIVNDLIDDSFFMGVVVY